MDAGSSAGPSERRVERQASNKDVVRAYVSAFNRGDVDGLCRLFARTAVVHGVLGWGAVANVRPIWEELVRCFAIQLRVDSLVAEGDTVAARFTESGSSRESFRGGPVTGRRYEVLALEWFVVRDGLIQRRWGARDSAAIYRQLGLSAAG